MRRVLGIAGWILLGTVVGSVAGYMTGPGEEALRVTPVVVTVLVTREVVATATVVDRNGLGGLAPKVVVKNYGLDIRSGPGAVYDVVGNAPEGSEYRIVGRNRAGDWWMIIFVDYGGKEAYGWLYAPFEKAVNTDLVGVVEALPTPTVEVLTTVTPEPTMIPAPTFTPGAGGSRR